MTMNKMMIIGNLGSDPEMRYTPSGQAVTSFRVATNYSYTTSDGERRDETEWFTISVWGRQAESCNQYLAKGPKSLSSKEGSGAAAMRPETGRPGL